MGKLADVIKWVAQINNRQITDQKEFLDATAIQPVVTIGSIDAGGIFRAGTAGAGGRLVADIDVAGGQQSIFMQSQNRALHVKDSRWWDWIPEGRTIFEDKFANTISWVQSTGTVAYSTVRPYPGNVNAMRLTTGAGAGNQAVASLGLFRLADAQSRGLGGTLSGDGPKIWYGVLWKNTDANLAFIQLTLTLDDAVTQMQAAVRLLTPSGQMQTMDAGGGFTSRGAAVALSTNERWHWLGMELHYQSGLSTLAYTRLRADDEVVDLTPYSAANNVAGSTINESLAQITVQNNAAIIEVCDIGYVVLKDLTNVRNLLG